MYYEGLEKKRIKEHSLEKLRHMKVINELEHATFRPKITSQ